MPTPTQRLAELGISLPPAPKPVASYVPVVVVEKAGLAFVAGQIPMKDGVMLTSGTLPNMVTLEQAQACARQCVLNGLAQLQAALGSIDRVKRIVKVGVFVACEPGFTDQPRVANGASDLLVEIFGEAGRHARAAVGVPALPLGAAVEVDFVVEV
jgi:enamine deaminase RidA (YjgF/YER057c/UK114 family)